MTPFIQVQLNLPLRAPAGFKPAITKNNASRIFFKSHRTIGRGACASHPGGKPYRPEGWAPTQMSQTKFPCFPWPLPLSTFRLPLETFYSLLATRLS